MDNNVSKKLFSLTRLTEAEQKFKSPSTKGSDFKIEVRQKTSREVRRMRERILRKQMRQSKNQGF
jgi:hypothetical protein